MVIILFVGRTLLAAEAIQLKEPKEMTSMCARYLLDVAK